MTSSQNASSQSRLEKADILELTVMHVRALEKEKAEYEHRLSAEPHSSDVKSYQLGYEACRQDICRLVNDPDVSKQRLLEYLSEQKQKILSDVASARLPDGRLALVFSSGAETASAPASSYHFNPVPATPPSSPAQQVAAPPGLGVWRPWF